MPNLRSQLRLSAHKIHELNRRQKPATRGASSSAAGSAEHQSSCCASAAVEEQLLRNRHSFPPGLEEEVARRVPTAESLPRKVEVDNHRLLSIDVLGFIRLVIESPHWMAYPADAIERSISTLAITCRCARVVRLTAGACSQQRLRSMAKHGMVNRLFFQDQIFQFCEVINTLLFFDWALIPVSLYSARLYKPVSG